MAKYYIHSDVPMVIEGFDLNAPLPTSFLTICRNNNTNRATHLAAYSEVVAPATDDNVEALARGYMLGRMSAKGIVVRILPDTTVEVYLARNDKVIFRTTRGYNNGYEAALRFARHYEAWQDRNGDGTKNTGPRDRFDYEPGHYPTN